MTIDLSLFSSKTLQYSLVLIALYVALDYYGLPIPEELAVALGLGFAGKEAAGKFSKRGNAGGVQ